MGNICEVWTFFCQCARFAQDSLPSLMRNICLCSTPVDVQYTGGYHEYTGGVQYTSGISWVHRWYIMINVGEVIGKTIKFAWKDQCTEHPPVYSWYPPHSSRYPPLYSWYSPLYSWYPSSVLNTSRCTQWYPPSVLHFPRCTAQTLCRVIMTQCNF